MQDLNAIVADVASTNIPVLLMGESGTGKEVYGRLIHGLSKHCDTPLKKLSCGTLEAAQSLAQLKSDWKSNGEPSQDVARTLFLDGIDELDLPCQKVLLSLLPDGQSEENGHNSARLIASTSRNLETEMEAGRFRSELYFRITDICLRLPPLRDRREDVLPLMEHFLTKYAAELGRKIPPLSDAETEFLARHAWPGNVRELENLARKIVVLGDAGKAVQELHEGPKPEAKRAEESPSFWLKVAARAASRQAERDLITKALERTHWNRKRAAQQLQISYKSLLYKIKQAGLAEKQKDQR